MFIACNIVLIVVAGLIAYWWANQGLFSALLHLLCVVLAGAIAFAFWEPLATGVLLRGIFFDDYAWGASLLMLFALSLFLLRFGMDRLAPANVNMPHWVNLSFGGVIGAAAGLLTIGILVIGLGHVQSTNKVLGVRGWSRSPRTGEVVQRDRLWIPFHTITSEFYSLLSVTSLDTRRPMRQFAPHIDRQATLVRDSYGGGRGKTSLQPSAATVERAQRVVGDGSERLFITVRFGLDAQDFGEQLTLSSSQIRLIEAVRGRTTPRVVHPIAWRGYSGYHRFDNLSHYLASEPGKESETADIEFDTPAGFVPAFIQIRGTRFRIPQIQDAPAGLAGMTGGSDTVVIEGGSIQDAVSVSSSIRPVNISLNVLPGSINEVDRWLTSGEATFTRSRTSGSRALRIQGIFEPAGTRIVRVNVSRGGPADLFRFTNQADENAVIALVDARGSEYSPIGYMYQHTEGTTIKLEPTKRLRTLSEIPVPPTSGTQKLELLFYVTEGVTVAGLRFGSFDVGSCSVVVPVTEADR